MNIGILGFLTNLVNRVFAPFTVYNLDLWNYGDPVPGDPITLWGKWNGVHQTWKFVQV